MRIQRFEYFVLVQTFLLLDYTDSAMKSAVGDI